MIEHYIRGFEEELREIRHQIHENPGWDYKNLKPVLWLRKSCASGKVEQRAGDNRR